MRQTSIASKRFQTESRDLLIINVSPLEFGASLLVPAVDSCLPQVLLVNRVLVLLVIAYGEKFQLMITFCAL